MGNQTLKTEYINRMNNQDYEYLVEELIYKLNINHPTSLKNRTQQVLKEIKEYFGKSYNNSKEETALKLIEDKKVTYCWYYNFDDEFQLADADLYTNNINLSDIIFNGDINEIELGYKEEQPFQLRNIKTIEDSIKWIIVHEYSHLLYPHLDHSNEFFIKVEKLYQSL